MFSDDIIITEYRDSRANDPRDWHIRIIHKPTGIRVDAALFGTRSGFMALKAERLASLERQITALKRDKKEKSDEV